MYRDTLLIPLPVCHYNLPTLQRVDLKLSNLTYSYKMSLSQMRSGSHVAT